MESAARAPSPGVSPSRPSSASLDVLEEILALLGDRGNKATVSQAKAALRGLPGGAGLASRLGKLTKARNVAAHPDPSLRADILRLVAPDAACLSGDCRAAGADAAAGAEAFPSVTISECDEFYGLPGVQDVSECDEFYGVSVAEAEVQVDFVGCQSDEPVVATCDFGAQVHVDAADGGTQHCAEDIDWTPAVAIDSLNEIRRLIRDVSSHLPPLEFFPDFARRANDFEEAFVRVMEPLTEIVQHCDGEDGAVGREGGGTTTKKRTKRRK